MLALHQINLQPIVGGGEVFTRFFSRALAEADASVRLYVQRDNRFWDSLAGSRVEVVPVSGPAELDERLPSSGALVITQSPLPQAFLERAAARHLLTGFAHMPMLGRSADEFRRYRAVFTVSQYCVDLLRAAGISQTYPEPIYGTFDLDRPGAAAIVARSPYAWDRRKLRDRVLGWAESLAGFSTKRQFEKRPGLTLGVVSMLAPIKQFPQLFSLIAPAMARAGVNLEIFGSGGYAQVRDIRRALAPLGGRVRFWGWQPAVQALYPQLDYLVTGLPEKEALGLNAIEAQACGTPVLAPRAPPFTETVVDDETGFLYRDPRTDGGAEFESLLAALLAGRPRPDPRRARAHLARFSYPALLARTRRLVEFLDRLR